jgi:hypothetical protein
MGKVTMGSGSARQNKKVPQVEAASLPIYIEVIKEVPVEKIVTEYVNVEKIVEVPVEVEKIIYVDRIVQSEPVVITEIEIVEVLKPVEVPVEIRVEDIQRVRALQIENEELKSKVTKIQNVCIALCIIAVILGVL